MTAGERSWPEDRRDERQEPARRGEGSGLANWLRRTVAPRRQEIWVMEPDGRLRQIGGPGRT